MNLASICKMKVAMSNIRSTRPLGISLLEIMVSISIISVLASITVPAIQRSRESARQMQCTSSLRQLSLAMQMRHDTFKSYANNGGYTEGDTILSSQGTRVVVSTNELAGGHFYKWGVGSPNKAGKTQSGSWAYAILPFIEQSDAYERIIVGPKQPLFLCSTRGRPDSLPTQDDAMGRYESGGLAWAKTDYAANGQIIKNSPARVSMSAITDGLSQTFLLGEKAFDPSIHTATSWYWDEPIFAGGSKGTMRTGFQIVSDRVGSPFPNLWGAAHPGGAIFARADGSVQMIQTAIDYDTFYKMMTPQGNEIIVEQDE